MFSSREWIRLADVRVPRLWWVGLICGLIAARHYNRRDERRLAKIGEELGTYYGRRDRDAAKREADLLSLNKALFWLTAAALLVAIASIAVALAD